MRQKINRHNFLKTPPKMRVSYNSPIGIQWGEVPEMCGIDDVIIIRSGPSVNNVDEAKVIEYSKRNNIYIIAVNGAGEYAPFADAWFTLDPWGLNGPQVPKNFGGELFAAVPDDYGTPSAKAAQHRVSPCGNITFLHRLQSHNYVNISSESAFTLGLSEDRRCISTGNSGYGALNFAYHLKPKRIFMLGIDGSVGYFYKSNTVNKSLTHLRQLFKSTTTQLKKNNIEVFNVSPLSTVDAFPKLTPTEFYDLIN